MATDHVPVYPRGTDSARVIQVIETKAMRGEGTDIQPSREVTQYWTLDGEFLAENDPDSTLIQVDGSTLFGSR